MGERQTFLEAIETFLTRSGWKPTRFGRESAGDPLFVFQLRDGREPREATRRKVLDFIASASTSDDQDNGLGAASSQVESPVATQQVAAR